MKQEIFKFRHCLLVACFYTASNILKTAANLFLINVPDQRATLSTVALILSIPLYILGIVAFYNLFDQLAKLLRGLWMKNDTLESWLFSILVLAFFVGTRIQSLLQPPAIENVTLEGMVGYAWLHVAFLVLLSTIPTGVLSLRFKVVKEEKAELQLLTTQLEREKQMVLKLLYNMVPREVALKLASGKSVEAGAHPFACVFFADVKGFTPFASSVPPMEVFSFLNTLISAMDVCISEFPEVYKTETVGDSFLAVSGIMHDGQLGGTGENFKSLCETLHFASIAQSILSSLPFGPSGATVPMRMGVHVGPVVAGLVGTLTPRFALFGDTINMTARLER